MNNQKNIFLNILLPGPIVMRHRMSESDTLESDVFSGDRSFRKSFRKILRKSELLVVRVRGYFQLEKWTVSTLKFEFQILNKVHKLTMVKNNVTLQFQFTKARSLVQQLGRKIQVQEVVGSNPAVHWMDVSNASYYISIEKKRIKVAKWGKQKKFKLKKKKNSSNLLQFQSLM